MAELPPPGWYPNPEAAPEPANSALRWWDGAEWADHLKPSDAQLTAQVHVASEYAGVGARFGAMVLDAILLAILLSPWAEFVQVTSEFQGEVTSFTTLQYPPGVALVAYLTYLLAFEGGAYGQTIGKWIVGIQVRHQEGPVGRLRALGRALMHFPSLYALGIGYIWAIFDKQSRTWHDLAASTLVRPVTTRPIFTELLASAVRPLRPDTSSL